MHNGHVACCHSIASPRLRALTMFRQAAFAWRSSSTAPDSFGSWLSLTDRRRFSAIAEFHRPCCAGEGLLSPSQVLVALHSMRTGKDGAPLLAVMTALTICLAQRQTFNRAAIAVALEQLVDRCRLRPAACLESRLGDYSVHNAGYLGQTPCR